MEELFTPHRSRKIIKSFEAKALKRRTYAMVVADILTSRFGSISFFFFNAAFFALWIVINSNIIPGIVAFDPFPFIFLTMVVSLEAIFLSIIVLMSQSRQGYISSLRDELMLQVNLISEREVTKILQLVTELHEHHKVRRENDAELMAMLKSLNTSYIEKKLEEQMRTEQSPSIASVLARPLKKLTHPVAPKKKHQV